MTPQSSDRAGASYPAPAETTSPSSLTRAGGRPAHDPVLHGAGSAQGLRSVRRFHLGDRVQARPDLCSPTGTSYYGVIRDWIEQTYAEDLYVVIWDDDYSDRDLYPESHLVLSDQPMPELKAVA